MDLSVLICNSTCGGVARVVRSGQHPAITTGKVDVTDLKHRRSPLAHASTAEEDATQCSASMSGKLTPSIRRCKHPTTMKSSAALKRSTLETPEWIRTKVHHPPRFSNGMSFCEQNLLHHNRFGCQEPLRWRSTTRSPRIVRFGCDMALCLLTPAS